MWFWTAASVVVCLAAPAAAKVVRTTQTSFVIEHKLAVRATPDAVWEMLGMPARWWSSEHSFSGDAANFSMDLKPGGCFCETLPGGGVEHARVIYADTGKLLRLSGALGPMQGEAVTGTLTFTLEPAQGGATSLTLRYAVAGDAGMAPATLAPIVDGVLGEQAQRLKVASEGA